MSSEQQSPDTNINVSAKKTTKGEIFKYGFGGAAINVVYMTYASYIIFFWTDSAMISAASAGTIYFLGRIIMAISDPIAGIMGDRTNTKFGKFRPYFMGTTPIVVILFFLIFTDFPLGEDLKIILYGALFIIFCFFAAIQTVSYEAQVPCMSADLSTRNYVVMSRQVIGTTLAVAATGLTIPLVNAFGGGLTGWHYTIGIYGIACIIFVLISANGSKRHDLPHPKEKHTEGEQKTSIRHDLKQVLSVKAVILLVVSFGFVIMASEVASATNMYIFKYAVGNEELLSLVIFACLPANFLAAFFTPVLVAKFGKKQIFMIAALVAMVRPLVFLFIKPFDSLAIIIIVSVIAQFAMIVLVVDVWTMVADCVEYVSRTKKVKSAAGLVTSCNTFMLDFGGAMAGIVVGGLMTMIGYNGAETFGSISESTLNGIIFINAGIPAIAYVGAFIICKFYPITNRILADLGANVGKQVIK